MTTGRAILATLTYHDIFSYPLTEDELFKYLISVKCTRKTLASELTKLSKTGKISQKDGYMYLKRKNQSAIKLRKLRARYSILKVKKANLYSTLLKAVPYIKLVAITGALAMNNSHNKDDIDFLIVTAKNRLWTTRFLANILLWPYRRKPSSANVNNKACLNIFIDESQLKITDKNLYTAHEICQMKPIWDREAMYQKFIKANSWVQEYLPHWESDAKRRKTSDKRPKKKSNALGISPLAVVIEKILKDLQLSYMSKKISKERILKGQLFFHPANTQSLVLAKYNQKLRNLKVS